MKTAMEREINAADWPDMADSLRPAADDDKALMLAFAQGDARAFERLYERHHRALYRFVRRLLGRNLAAQVDEVFQDTWLRVVRERERYTPRAAQFRTWLFTLAHHRAIDGMRRGGREVALPDQEAAMATEPLTPAGAAWSRWPRADCDQDDVVFWRRAGARLLDCPARKRRPFCRITKTASRWTNSPVNSRSAWRPQRAGCATP
jgi:RNA polymerase sigma-70 factor (ECF subfamily)